MTRPIVRAAGQESAAARVLAKLRDEFDEASESVEACAHVTSPLLTPIVHRARERWQSVYRQYKLACLVAWHSGVELNDRERGYVREMLDREP